MARTLIVWGTGSGAGKSWLATALCALARRRGIDVAPFKAQNMSNNARVAATPEGGTGEIGSAQWLQACAAGVLPHTDHNPVLLKPERDTASQVVVNGHADAELSRMGWRERSMRLAQASRQAFDRLAARHELLVVEGAGSPAEINLAPYDYVNLHTARWALQHGAAAALLVTDIDRGGAFAHVHGTQALLPPDLRPLLQGYVLNRFRGDAALLAPGPELMQGLNGLPLLGVLPLLRGHGLPEEDGWFGNPATPAGPGDRVVAVLAPPRLSNLDEFAPLARLPGVALRWVREPAALRGAHWVVLPGSKQTSGDLAWLHDTGLAAAVRAHAAAGGAVLGLCGGLQLLGRTLHDPSGADGEAFDTRPGLGLLPLATHFGPGKRLRAATVRFGPTQGPWQALSGLAVPAYEIRCGHTQAEPGSAAAVLHADDGSPIGWQQGPVLGLYAHGLFEAPAVQQALLGATLPALETVFDQLADHAQAHLDPTALHRLLGA